MPRELLPIYADQTGTHVPGRSGLDHGDQAHLVATRRADQDVLVPHPAEQVGPGQTPSALGIVGSRRVVGRRLRPLLIYRLASFACASSAFTVEAGIMPDLVADEASHFIASG